MQHTIWEKFPRLTKAIQADHKARGVFGGAHDFYHALMVAQYALLIADSPFEELARVAGLCHNHPHRLYSREEGEAILRSHLDECTGLSTEEKALVLHAVLEHSKKNDPADHPVTMALKDADRLGNIGPHHWLRAAQFRPTILPVDPRFITTADPTATFKNPKTILQDIKHTLEWESWLRLPKARELGKPMFDEIRRFLAIIENQFETLGLLPFPPELVVEPNP